jgi:hypothetical protein
MIIGLPGANGHHAIIPNFDLDQEIVLTDAVVTEFKFVNPHVYIYLDVPGEPGVSVNWRCEMTAASRLRRRGWTDETLVPGETIAIAGSPARRENNVCHVGTITLEDGSILTESAARPDPSEFSNLLASDEIIQSRPAYLANGQPNLRGPWVATQRAIRLPDIDPTAAGALAADGLVRQFDSPALRCQSANIIFDWMFEREPNDIYQDDETITLQYGYLDLVRRIHLDQSEHSANVLPSVTGHSIGRWEGDTLVVDTVGFEPGFMEHTAQSGFRMHSDQLHVVERFEVGAGGRNLTRTYVFDDPLFMQGTYTGEDTQSLTTEAYLPYDCEELSGQNNLRTGE